jgi:small nuclear ribonucleoprotein G
VLDDAIEEKDGGEKVRLGMVVCSRSRNCDWIVANIPQVIRGNSVVMLEALERIGGDRQER